MVEGDYQLEGLSAMVLGREKTETLELDSVTD
jgi:hypothetical protein